MNRKKGLFTKWTAVFYFTVKQAVSGRGFKLVTAGVAAIVFLSLFLVNVLTAALKDDDKAELTMKEVFVSDETGMIASDDQMQAIYDMYPEELKDMAIRLEKEKTAEEIAEEYIGKESAAVVLKIAETEKEKEKIFLLELLIPDGSTVGEESGEEFVSLFSDYFSTVKLMNSGIQTEKLVHILSPVMANVSQAGEEADTMGEMLIKMMAPMLFALLVYMMLLMYGQGISKCIIAEKTSKLMETMLTTLRPYAIITGKVLGMAAVAIGQFVLWVAMALAGFLIGDVVASAISPDYENIVLHVVELVRADAAQAFSVPSIVLFVLITCISFVMYCVIAAMMSSGAKKAEDLSNCVAIYNIIVVVAFLVSYFIPMQGNVSVGKILNYIPFTAAFKLPVDLLVGSVSYGSAFVGTFLILVTMFVFILVTGKIYKKKIF